ncbi:unnamed protein product, partial [Nesidiocoris tenuis]
MSLVLLLPTLALGIRRMHDIGRTGWWFGIAYLLPLLNRLLSVIAINYASPSAYVYINLTLSVVLFWAPVILVITLSSRFNSGNRYAIPNHQPVRPISCILLIPRASVGSSSTSDITA